MAGPLDSAAEIKAPGPRASWEGPLGGVGWFFAWLDYAIYSLEHAMVVMALITMTLIEFIYILSIYVIEQSITIKRFQAGEEVDLPVSALVLLSFVVVLLFSVVSNTKLGRISEDELRSLGLRIGATVGLLAGVMGFAALTRVLENSSSFYLLLVVMVMTPAMIYFWKLGKKGIVGTLGVVFVILLYITTLLPPGFSWADNRALFLLLWVGFQGSSMAAKQGRHIKIDIARKICPPRFLHTFNGFSYLMAASFSGFLVYLSYIYMFHEDYGRFWARTLSGEIPDWLVVLAIPVSFFMISARFLGRSVRAFLGFDKEEDSETSELTEEASS